ncbi:hypothetical protein BRARA_G02140 [Brassica rapa]|uniref:F-box domain-containing protein n=1 Tax=Brassica campestris TaxID=3711 RepID=A0A397YV18_BRACM|nr:hypothetical protein BRARA_G02140 [Brassica rapa]
MSELPFDLLAEILIRVPVNDIIRFRFVLFDDMVVVWNPSLREVRTIPTLTNEHFYISSHWGFWYDHSIKDYNILLIPCIQFYDLWRGSYNKFKRQAEILTLKSSPRMIDFHTDKHLYDHD